MQSPKSRRALGGGGGVAFLALLASILSNHAHEVDAFSVVRPPPKPAGRTAHPLTSPPSAAPSSSVGLRTSLPTAVIRSTALLASSAAGDSDPDADSNGSSIDITTDPRLYRIRLPRAPGIEWGTDLSFSFVYVRDLEPAGPASISGEVDVGDQICELRPVVADGGEGAINLIGAPFDGVMNSFAVLGKDVRDVDLVFFRGTKEELKAACSGDGTAPEAETVTLTVVQNKGSDTETIQTIEAPMGCNVREVLADGGINVYQSVTRWTNCKGKQLCGTCIVNVPDGGPNTNRKSMDEGSTLRENPDSYRLSCVTFAYGDVTIETLPPIKAAQWTR